MSISPKSTKTNAREWMQEALIRLLRTQKLSKITVAQLTKTAGVSRTTFYRNYNEISDIIFDYLETSDSGLPNPDASNFYLPRFIRSYFEFFHNNRTLVYCIQSNNLFPRLMATLDYKIGTQAGFFIAAYGFENQYEVSALVGILYKILLDWIRNGMKENIDEMSMVVYGIITKFNCIPISEP